MPTEEITNDLDTSYDDNEVVEDDNTEPTEDVDNSEEETSQEPKDEEEKTQKFNSPKELQTGYDNLQKKYGEQSNEIGTLRKQAEEQARMIEELKAQQLNVANNYGFDSVEDFQAYQQNQQYENQLAQYVADEYANYIGECEYPDEMVNLLVRYRNNPNKELLEAIKSEFSSDVREAIAGKLAIAKGQLEAQKAQALQEQQVNNVKAYLEANVPQYQEEFKSPALQSLYGQALNILGTNLDTKMFMQLMNAYKSEVLKQYNIDEHISSENAKAKDELVGLSAQGQQVKGSAEKDILSMSEAEMLKEIRKYK